MNRVLMVTVCWLFTFIIAIPLQAGEILLTIPQPPPGYYSQYFGREVANVGDHNDDGFDDFIVGQPGFVQNGGTTYGYAHFFHGGPYVDPLPEISMQGPNWDARLGWSVTELGDFNADGQPDFAASRPGGEVSGVNVYWGGDALDNEVDLSLTNNQPYSWFGGKISGGHDLNGDGHPDLVVAANQDDSGPGEDGRIYIYHGGPLADQQVDMILDAQFPTSGFGYNLQLTGDVTGDGWADLLVLNWDPHLLLIYAGGPDFDADPDIQIDLPELGDFPEYWSPDQLLPQVEAGDLDGDGQPEIVIGLPLESSGGEAWVLQAGPDHDFAMGRVLHARSSGECFGRMVDVSGDYNGDGIADLLVGSRGPYPSGLNGYLFVYPGGDLDDLNLSLVMTDQSRYQRFGASAVSLGDLDGDGDDELLVGSVSPYGYVWIVDEMFFDCDDDDIPDWQQGAEDCDGDLIPDICQVALWPQDDCNTNGVVDSCEITQDPGIDCDGNGLIDSCEIAAYPDLDCDENGILDSCQLPADPGLDCDGNGQIDSCEIEDDPSLDCDQNAILDVCQLAADPGLDCDGNGQIDSCEIAAQANLDCDVNGVLDSCQMAEDPGWDCDNNGLFDICEWTANPGLDCNLNSILDVCELAADPDLDCDSNGVIDACQIAGDYMADSDGDGVLDICQFPGILSLYSNSGYTSSNLSVSEPGPVGPFYLVLNIPLEAGLVTHVEMSMSWPESLAGLDVQVEPGLAYDADPAPEGLVLYYGEPMVPDADGNLMVAQVWGILPDADVMDIQISIMGNSSAAANPDLTVPSWTDDTGETHLINETNPGNINGDLSDSPTVEPPFRLTLNNHPNPFNPRTTIRMELPVAGAAKLEILDLSGRVIREFEIMADSAGSRDLIWHGTDRQGRQMASGIYLARLTQGAHSAQKKLVLLR